MGKLAPFLILAAGGLGVWFLFRFLFPKPSPICPLGEVLTGKNIISPGTCVSGWHGGPVAADPDAPPPDCSKASANGWHCSNDVTPLPKPPADWPGGQWFTAPPTTVNLSSGGFWGAAPVTYIAPTMPSHPPGVATPPFAGVAVEPACTCPGSAHPLEPCFDVSGMVEQRQGRQAKKPCGQRCKGVFCLFTNFSE